MDTSSIGRFVILIGFVVVIIGVLIWAGSKMGIPLGRLPGDIGVSGQKYSFYFPIVSSIVISIILTILLNVLIWLFKKPQ
jgi:hypothetical protein